MTGLCSLVSFTSIIFYFYFFLETAATLPAYLYPWFVRALLQTGRLLTRLPAAASLSIQPVEESVRASH